MKFSLVTLSFLAVTQYGSAFAPGASPRSFARSGPLKSIAEPPTPTTHVNGKEAVGEAVQAAKADAPPLTLAQKYVIGTNMKFPLHPPEVFKGVKLGDWNKAKGVGDINDSTVEVVFNKYAARDAPKMFASLFGKSKDSPMDFVRETFTDLQGFRYTVPNPEDYEFFGNGDYEKQLPMLLKTNPFMASALTETDDGFELKSYDPNCSEPTLFQQIIGTLTGEGRRVNMQFDSKLEKITSFQVYDKAGNQLTGNLDRKYYTTAAIYNIFVHASCLHATIHVLHYLMTSALVEATKDFTDMNELADSYAKNVRNKYIQVGSLLITDPTTEIEYAPDGSGVVVVPADASLITGLNGMGSSQAMRPILENLLNTWGKAGSARELLGDLMNISESKMEEAGILTEFRKHFDLINPFARQMRKAFKNLDRSKFYDTEANIEKYLKDCGTFESDIDGIGPWLEIMSATGLIHGATLSYSRLGADNNVMRWRDIHTTAWDAADINLVNGILGTIVGVEEGRHLMGSEMLGEYHENVQEVLDKFDNKAENLKYAYKKELLKDRETFNKFGFILTDYGPDNFDGKQLTIATYI